MGTGYHLPLSIPHIFCPLNYRQDAAKTKVATHMYIMCRYPLGDEAHFILRSSELSLVEARDRYFETMRDSFGGEWDRGDNELLTKMLRSMDITTNTKTIIFLQRVLCLCKDLPG